MADTNPSPEDLAELGLTRLMRERERLDRIDRYLRGVHDGPYVPRSASEEYKLLAKRAITNWLPLLVKAPSQAMAVEGFRRPAGGVGAEAGALEWEVWQANRMDARQASVMRAALAYGQSFVTVLPGPVTPENPAGPARPVIRGVSPRLMYASYEDPAGDDLPQWALQVDAVPQQEGVEVPGRLFDATTVYEVVVGGKTGPRVTGNRPHGLTRCPVVRFAPDVDLEGRVTGVVEPMIPIQDRINQNVFDLLVVATFGAFKVRTIAGMTPEFVRDADGELVYDSTTGKPRVVPIQADASRFLVAPDPDTKFNQLDETPLSGYIEAIELGVRHLAAVSQTPPFFLLGSVVNLSAEALAASEAGLTRAVDEYKHALGEAWELVLGLCGLMVGREMDPHAQVVWRDAGSRSLSQTVDALGKAVQMLNVPARAMWSRIPGVTATDVEDWSLIQDQDDPAARLAESMAKAVAPPVVADAA
ncbi:phage portal protein [Streptomyces sp. HU2014]|uniref:phage portal protein n=1 Tax=Streptomyces sp. HU2014 TaxID=2939414 RepID=UPI00200CE945|nr:phage portal protein [Streptomyces sp. HU2014]UQI46728.1 phage portal protein [Streptomyces sp. HU2014]